MNNLSKEDREVYEMIRKMQREQEQAERIMNIIHAARAEKIGWNAIFETLRENNEISGLTLSKIRSRYYRSDQYYETLREKHGVA